MLHAFLLLQMLVSENILHHKSKTAMKPSASCPTMLSRQPLTGYRGGRQKEPPPPMMTVAERLVWEKERMKKDNHNISQLLSSVSYDDVYLQINGRINTVVVKNSIKRNCLCTKSTNDCLQCYICVTTVNCAL